MNKQQFYIEKDGIECVGVDGIPDGAVVTVTIFGREHQGRVVTKDGEKWVFYGIYKKPIQFFDSIRIESINNPDGTPAYERAWTRELDITISKSHIEKRARRKDQTEELFYNNFHLMSVTCAFSYKYDKEMGFTVEYWIKVKQ